MNLEDRSVCRIHVQKPVTSLTLQYRHSQNKLVFTLQHPISLQDLRGVYVLTVLTQNMFQTQFYPLALTPYTIRKV